MSALSQNKDHVKYPHKVRDLKFHVTLIYVKLNNCNFYISVFICIIHFELFSVCWKNYIEEIFYYYFVKSIFYPI